MFARVLVLAPAKYRSRHHRSLIEAIRSRMALHRSRAALARLDSHLLQDIGLSANEAANEAHRPVWR